jgi:hypothetical protein
MAGLAAITNKSIATKRRMSAPVKANAGPPRSLHRAAIARPRAADLANEPAVAGQGVN